MCGRAVRIDIQLQTMDMDTWIFGYLDIWIFGYMCMAMQVTDGECTSTCQITTGALNFSWLGLLPNQHNATGRPVQLSHQIYLRLR